MVRNKKNVLKVYCIFFITLSLVVGMIYGINSILMPVAISISQMNAKARANIMVDDAVKKVLQEQNVKAVDFYINNNSVATETDYISTNTVLINQLCADISSNINGDVMMMTNSKIMVPLGTIMGIAFLHNHGPQLIFELMPKGSVKVDYETEFLSVGINQTNYRVWLNVSIEMQIVNPLRKSNVVFERKIALVDTLINGKVPERYMNFQNN